MMPKVCVIMSTFNGEKYVEEQINSILRQTNVEVTLYIRDDASKDNTPKVLKQIKERNNNVLLDLSSINLGFQNSFFKALKDAPEADYYAFSDQDDIWYLNKLSSTIDLIVKTPEKCLAIKNALLGDAYLHPIGIQYTSDRKIPLRINTFYQSLGSGYLMVFNKTIKQYAERIEEKIPISHDLFIGAIACYLGNVVYDSEIVAIHRRLSYSISANNKNKVLKHRIKSVFVDKGKVSECASLFLKYYKKELSDDEVEELICLRDYRIDCKKKWILLTRSDLRYNGIVGYLAIKIKILINRF